MSLDTRQLEQTRAEPRANLSLSGLDIAELAAALGLTAIETERTLDIAPNSRPENVWLVRDYLESAVRARRDVCALPVSPRPHARGGIALVPVA